MRCDFAEPCEREAVKFGFDDDGKRIACSCPEHAVILDNDSWNGIVRWSDDERETKLVEKLDEEQAQSLLSLFHALLIAERTGVVRFLNEHAAKDSVGNVVKTVNRLAGSLQERVEDRCFAVLSDGELYGGLGYASVDQLAVFQTHKPLYLLDRNESIEAQLRNGSFTSEQNVFRITRVK
jgi:hypothetical protein